MFWRLTRVSQLFDMISLYRFCDFNLEYMRQKQLLFSTTGVFFLTNYWK